MNKMKLRDFLIFSDVQGRYFLIFSDLRFSGFPEFWNSGLVEFWKSGMSETWTYWTIGNSPSNKIGNLKRKKNAHKVNIASIKTSIVLVPFLALTYIWRSCLVAEKKVENQFGLTASFSSWINIFFVFSIMSKLSNYFKLYQFLSSCPNLFQFDSSCLILLQVASSFFFERWTFL